MAQRLVASINDSNFVIEDQKISKIKFNYNEKIYAFVFVHLSWQSAQEVLFSYERTISITRYTIPNIFKLKL